MSVLAALRKLQTTKYEPRSANEKLEAQNDGKTRSAKYERETRGKKLWECWLTKREPRTRKCEVRTTKYKVRMYFSATVLLCTNANDRRTPKATKVTALDQCDRVMTMRTHERIRLRHVTNRAKQLSSGEVNEELCSVARSCPVALSMEKCR